MPANPKADAISLLRRVSSLILDTYAKAMTVRSRADVLTAGVGFAPEDFDGSNSDLAPADFAALEAALDSLKTVFLDAQGGPTPAAVALIRFANSPVI